MRGFKRDQSATLLRGCADKRSFVSQPKIIEGECTEPKPHLILYGKDKEIIRAEIFRLDRLKNAGVNRCWKCNREVFEINDYNDDGPYAGEWDHIRNKPGERCDCPENGRVACRQCHSERHPQPRFGRHETNNADA